MIRTAFHVLVGAAAIGVFAVVCLVVACTVPWRHRRKA